MCVSVSVCASLCVCVSVRVSALRRGYACNVKCFKTCFPTKEKMNINNFSPELMWLLITEPCRNIYILYYTVIIQFKNSLTD